MMAKSTFRGIGRLLVTGVILLGHAAWLAAQTAGGLPPASDYRGEIRRGADGKLMALPEPPVIETAPLESPAPLVHPAQTASHANKSAAPAPAPTPVPVPAPAATPAPTPAAATPPVASPPRATTLLVGPGERITSITEAARLARDGDIVEIKPGEYRGQPAVWTQRDITIRGVGKRPVMVADNQLAEDKGIWVVRGERVRIENIEFRGARVADMNGAGIRFDKGSLSVVRCAFFDNEMGILTANSPELSLAVIDSEFADSPHTTNDFHHLLYVGRIGKLVLRGSRFRNGYYGHLVKTRARENYILYNVMVDGANGHASYELEFPNGGVAYVIGNVIGQGPESENPSIVAYGSEGLRWTQNAIYLVHNTIINDANNANYLLIKSDRGTEAVEVWALNNLIVGPGEFRRPAAGRFEGNQTVVRSALVEQAGVPTRLPAQSPLRGTVRPPGKVGNVDLTPDSEFVFPVGTKPMLPSARQAPGAFQ